MTSPPTRSPAASPHPAPPPRVLLVEDDTELAALVVEYLGAHGFAVDVTADGDAAIAAVRQAPPALVLLDVLLPGTDGLEVCRVIRGGYDGPIVMLTALGSDVDQIVGLELGADDYLVKPVSPRLLLARLRLHLRRAPPQDEVSRVPHVVQAGPLRVDARARTVHMRDHAGAERAVPLTTAEFELVMLLARHAGTVLDRDALYLALRGTPYDGIDRSLDLRVSRVRKKLGPGAENLLKSVRGQGYLLAVPG